MTSHEQLSLFPSLDFDKYPQLNKAFTSNQIFLLHKLFNEHTQHVMQLMLIELSNTQCDKIAVLELPQKSIEVFEIDEDPVLEPQQNVTTDTIRDFIDNNPALLVPYLSDIEFVISTLAHLLQLHLPLSEHDKLPVEKGSSRTHFAARVTRVALSNSHVWPNNPFIHVKHGVYRLRPEYIRAAEVASASL